MNSGLQSNEQQMLDQVVQESLRENPNPDLMSYEQLQELGDQIGTVSKGYTKEELKKLKPLCNFDNKEDCPV